MKTALTLTMLAFALAAERLHQTEPRDMPPEPEEHPTLEEYKAHWRGTTDIQTMNDTAPTVGRLISPRVGEQIAEELSRSANTIASYYEKHKSEMPANVAYAMTREMARLRDLAARVKPTPQEEDEEED